MHGAADGHAGNAVPGPGRGHPALRPGRAGPSLRPPAAPERGASAWQGHPRAVRSLRQTPASTAELTSSPSVPGPTSRLNRSPAMASPRGHRPDPDHQRPHPHPGQQRLRRRRPRPQSGFPRPARRTPRKPRPGAAVTGRPRPPPPRRWRPRRTKSSSSAVPKSSRSKPLELWAGPGGGAWSCSALTRTATPSDRVPAAGVAWPDPGGQRLGQSISIKTEARIWPASLKESPDPGLGRESRGRGNRREGLGTDSEVSGPGSRPSSGAHSALSLIFLCNSDASDIPATTSTQ